eukprot:CAMPEP_0183312246 /NCGR_PEP_ID=MMETSP0160_2-20130417/40912_1 /TAXON_ID=2839 ORGANISM="Odontella Sinensis, Strain Grunow 1884" /NCGR_SAMPLE_ID=MMETSP0160_2 /ASSEMBLY_ACC=CAM_ASM_000250 /LENGTH=269 /DNA_ID=CAMNT_0025477063 /DNA_START=53 /DNA_END=859 /DNA_ORIENTATION=+
MAAPSLLLGETAAFSSTPNTGYRRKPSPQRTGRIGGCGNLECRVRPFPSIPPSATQMRGSAVDFRGSSTSSLIIPLPPDAACFESRTLPEFLLRSPDAIGLLLGSEDFAPLDDGGSIWDCPQAPVEWFGLDLAPVFINHIDRDEARARVMVTIVDARSEFGESGGKVSDIVGGLMKRSTFDGKSVFAWEDVMSWHPSNDKVDIEGRGWTLNADLSLTLKVPLSRFTPVPPGFNSVGSRIVQRTCRKRLERTLEDLREAYFEWARQPLEW